MRKMPLQSATKKRLALAGIALCLCVTLFISSISIGSVGVSLLSGFKPIQSGPYLYLHGSDGAVYVLNAYGGTIDRQYNLNYQSDVFNPDFRPWYIINDQGILYYEGYRGIYAARLQDGTVLWKHYLSTVSFGSVSLLTVIGGTLFASNDFVLYALRARDGALLWQYDLSKDFIGEKPSPAPFGSVSLLTVIGGTVFARSNFMLYALHASDGTLLWRYDLSKDFTGEEPRLINDTLTASGILCFAGTTPNNGDYALVAIDSLSGSFLWKHKLSSDPGSSAVVDGVFYVASDTILYAYRPRDGSLLWEHRGVNTISSFAVSKSFIIIRDTNNIYALRTSDHSFPIWFYHDNDNSITDQLSVTNDTVYTDTLALRIDDGQLLWRYNNSDTFISQIDDSSGIQNVVYGYRTVMVSPSSEFTYLEAIQRSSGTVVWQQKVNVATFLDAMISHGVIFLLNNGFICAYAASTGQFLWQQNIQFGPISPSYPYSSFITVADG